MLVFRGLRKYDHVVRAARRNRKPIPGRDNAGQRPKGSPQSPDLDSQSCAIAFVGPLCSECSRYERFPGHVRGPLFCERSRKRE
jgi:hypothetical protein